MATRLANFARLSGLLSPHHSGLLNGLAAADAATVLKHEIKSLQVSTLFSDTKGVFHNIQRTTLANNLRSKNNSAYIISWVTSYLSTPSCMPVFEGGPQSFQLLSIKAPQGSSISPLLFLIHTPPHYKDPHLDITLSHMKDFAVTAAGKSHRDALPTFHSNFHHISTIGPARNVTFSGEETYVTH